MSTILIIACQKEPILTQEDLNASAKKSQANHSYEFDYPVFDIASTPDGSIMLGLNDESRSIKLIKNGEVRDMVSLHSPTRINGIATIGAGNAFVTTEGSDLAQDGELYRISNGNVRMVADLADFEFNNDPDANEGLQWKNVLCEESADFSAGPQNNPFKVIAVSGSTAFVADAAGNTILEASTTGAVDWKAILPPPLENGDFKLLFSINSDIPCYVQPVPTSLALGPDGYLYVGELTGAVAGGFPIGLSRIWKLPADGSHLVCQEDTGDCEVFKKGLTSIIDMEIGPDGRLYVVQFDQSSWFSVFVPDLAQGGTITAYDLNDMDPTSEGEIVAGNLSFPSAITFDNKGNLWVLENNDVNNPVIGKKPVVRMLDYSL
ncbi:ScyD/ScyE family protein [Salinimicrobium soli]|uniref:ScyD/ScyE family protein n=1 Tax=Salinimicrobium soli TaxID=1254399 RepID=UPI003AAE70F4